MITDRNGRPVQELANLGELAFIQTPVGLLCQEARRAGPDIWVRSIEYIVPNIVQLAQVPTLPPTYRDGETRITFAPMVTRWRVPIDDTHTLELAFVRVRHGQENAYADRPSKVILSNYGGRPYDEMQRFPGDYEAQISQRPIARHGLEHLGKADRGVTMMRHMIREGIRAAAAGQDPMGVHRDHVGPWPTFGNDTVIRVAPAASADDDDALVRATARQITQSILQAPPMTAGAAIRI